MEQGARTRWTDERLDDFAGHVDARFDAVDRRFDGVDRRFDRVEDELRSLRDLVLRSNIGMMLGFVSVLAAIVVRGG